MADTSLLFNVLAKDKASGVLSKVGGAAKAMGVAAAAGIFLLGKQSVDAARDLNETQSKVGVLFGKSAADITRFADTAAVKMGQSKQAVLDGASTFAVYGKGAGLAGKNLVGFSTGLTSLASDMASFSNTSPEEAIQAIGAAMRGESDPIEKYGVLLNENVIKNRALKEGIISTTKDALTPQQRVLAVQAELFAQTKDAQGDFARTSSGLANQQRILTAQWANMKTTIGQALLPVVTQFTTVLTSQVMPAMMQLWSVHGPAITAFLKQGADSFGVWAGQLQGMDWKGMFGDAKQAIGDLGPALAEVKNNGPAFADTLKVGGEVVGFLAEHSDLLAKALPYLAAGFLVVKAAQVAANVVAAVSVPLRIAEMMAQRRLAASNAQLTAAIVTQTSAARGAAASSALSTAATTAGDVAQKRSIISTIAAKAATIATSVATKAAAAAQWLFNAAMAANPIGLIVIAVIALVAGLIWAYKNVDWFRNAVNAVWKAIVGYVQWAVGMWMTIFRTWWAVFSGFWTAIGSFVVAGAKRWWSGVTGAFRLIVSAAGWLKDQVTGRVSAMVGLFTSLPGRISRATSGMFNGIRAAFRSAINWIVGKWNGLSFTIGGGSFMGMSVPSASFGTPNLPYLAKGGNILQGGSVVVGDAGPEILTLPSGATVTPLSRGGGAGGLVRVVIDLLGADADLKRRIQNMVRVDGQGDVQLTFGQAR